MADYVELQVTSNFSFLRGGAHPEELVKTAAGLGHRAIAVTDRNTLAGVVRAHGAAKVAGIQAIIGARLDLLDGASLLCLPSDRAAYGRLARLLTLGKRRAGKAECLLRRADIRDFAQGQILIVIPPGLELGPGLEPRPAFAEDLTDWAAQFPASVYLAASVHYQGEDVARLAGLQALAEAMSSHRSWGFCVDKVARC